MKNYVFTLMLLVSVLGTDIANAVSDDNQIPLVVIDDIRTGSSTTRRAAVFLPLECYYDSLLNGVVVSFLKPLGYVNIVLDAISTGEAYSTIVNSSDMGQCIIPVSGESGCYMISFSTDDGKLYRGVFEI